jgi:hypothetical protein
MKSVKQYFFEHVLVAAVMLLTVTGFWEIYAGENAAPNAYQHLHVLTDFIWLFLMWYQLSLLGNRRHGDHRKVGLAVLVMGPLLVATTALLLGIALVFTLISWVPQFKIEGPETFHRFQDAAVTGQGICLVVGVLFVVKDFRNGWPYLLAGLFFVLNEVIRSWLARNQLIEPITEFVGSMNQPVTFVGSFAVLLGLLAATGMLKPRTSGASPTPS